MVEGEDGYGEGMELLGVQTLKDSVVWPRSSVFLCKNSRMACCSSGVFSFVGRSVPASISFIFFLVTKHCKD